MRGVSGIKKRSYKSTNVLWKCSKSDTCCGSVTTNSSYTKVIKRTKHSCVLEMSKNKVDVCRYKTRSRTREETTISGKFMEVFGKM